MVFRDKSSTGVLLDWDIFIPRNYYSLSRESKEFTHNHACLLFYYLFRGNNNIAFMKKQHAQRGFSLIELLVAIAVIGIIAGVILVVINPAQKIAQARDATRKSDMAQIRTALETYFASHGEYPSVSTSSDSDGNRLSTNSDATGSPVNGGNWFPVLAASGELSVVPQPRNVGGPCNYGGSNLYESPNCYFYAYNRFDNGQSYVLLARLENTSDSSRCQIVTVVSFKTASVGPPARSNVAGQPNSIVPGLNYGCPPSTDPYNNTFYFLLSPNLPE